MIKVALERIYEAINEHNKVVIPLHDGVIK